MEVLRSLLARVVSWHAGSPFHVPSSDADVHAPTTCSPPSSCPPPVSVPRVHVVGRCGDRLLGIVVTRSRHDPDGPVSLKIVDLARETTAALMQVTLPGGRDCEWAIHRERTVERIFTLIGVFMGALLAARRAPTKPKPKHMRKNKNKNKHLPPLAVDVGLSTTGFSVRICDFSGDDLDGAHQAIASLVKLLAASDDTLV